MGQCNCRVIGSSGELGKGGCGVQVPAGRITLRHDIIPAMMTRSPEQTRRDCLFYVLHRA